MIICDNGSYYTGYTNDLEKRFQSHIDGKGAAYTRAFKPVKIVASWQILADTKSTPFKVEAFIKSLTRTQKEKLVQEPVLLKKWLDFKANIKLTSY